MHNERKDSELDERFSHGKEKFGVRKGCRAGAGKILRTEIQINGIHAESTKTSQRVQKTGVLSRRKKNNWQEFLVMILRSSLLSMGKFA